MNATSGIDDERRRTIAEMYRRADELGWDSLSSAERTTWYNRWLDDTDIGGALERLMPRDRIRGWMKDVPMKHYVRARSGIGPYAALAPSRLPDATEITRLALGDSWVVVDGTLRDKPNRCVTAMRDGRVHLFWGRVRNFQSLVWAGLNSVVDGAHNPLIVVLLHQGELLSDGQIERHRRMGELVGVRVQHLTVKATSSRKAGGTDGP